MTGPGAGQFFAIDLPILTENLRIMSAKLQRNHHPLSARFMQQAADAIVRLTMHSQGWRLEASALTEALEQARGDAAAAEEQNAVLQAQLTEIDRTMAVVGVGPFKTWKDAQMQAYDAVRALSAQVNTLQAYIEDLETLVLADSADPAPGAKDGTS